MNQAWHILIVALAAALPGFMAWLNSRSNTKKVDEVHKDLNSRLTELIRLTREAAHLQGVIEGTETGKQEERKRVANLNP